MKKVEIDKRVVVHALFRYKVGLDYKPYIVTNREKYFLEDIFLSEDARKILNEEYIPYEGYSNSDLALMSDDKFRKIGQEQDDRWRDWIASSLLEEIELSGVKVVLC